MDEYQNIKWNRGRHKRFYMIIYKKSSIIYDDRDHNIIIALGMVGVDFEKV